MEDCLDIYGNRITRFIFNDDGTVSGVLIQTSGKYNQETSSYGGNILSSSTLTQLSQECCQKLNFSYNTKDNKCYYKNICNSTESDSSIGEIVSGLEAISSELEGKINTTSSFTELTNLNTLLSTTNDNLNYWSNQLSPNGIKLIFGANGNSPILFEVENAQGELTLDQEENCVQLIRDLNREILELQETRLKYSQVNTKINNNITKLKANIDNLESENLSLLKILEDSEDKNSESVKVISNQINTNISLTNQYTDNITNLGNQLVVITNQSILIDEQIAALQEELAALMAVCNPTPPPCNLNIGFDYLWNFNCDELLTCSASDASILESLTAQHTICLAEVTSIQNEIINVTNHMTELSNTIADQQLLLVSYEASLENNSDPIQIFTIEAEIQNINQTLVGYANQYIVYQDKLTVLNSNLTSQIELCNQLSEQISSINAYGSLINSLQNVVFYQTIEKQVLNTVTNLYEWQTVYEKEFFRIDDLLTHITNNSQTGIYFNGDRCNELIENISLQLGENCDVISANTFNSQWLHLSNTIDSTTTWNGNNVMLQIVNEYITFGIRIEYNNPNCQYCLMMDRIEMNQVCEKTEDIELLVNRCPSFELRRVVDNKKSWMNVSSSQIREFDLTNRETYYKTNHYKAVINSKELDLEVNPAHGIESDLFNYVNNYGCILSGTTGQTNYLDFITSDISEISNVDEFNYVIGSELIDVKSRKVISSYPALRAIYDRYLSPSDYGCTGTTSNAYCYSDLITYSNLLGTFWVDLIEQVIPSTAIWGSVYKYSNSIFDNDKFKYRRYSTNYCEKGISNCDFNRGITTSSNIIIEDLSKENQSVYPECFIANSGNRTCNYITTQDYNDSCEYHGKVIVINPADNAIDNSVSGGGVVLQEDVDYYINKNI